MGITMKNDENEIFVVYDDNNWEHVKNGPNYGQPCGEGWTEESTTDWWLNKWEKETVEELVL
jgi:hypothetical protein